MQDFKARLEKLLTADAALPHRKDVKGEQPDETGGPHDGHCQEKPFRPSP
jgi:hypothetical protein